MCDLDAREPLLDIDGIGVICVQCDERGYPPHHDYLYSLLGIDWDVVARIAEYAYPACSPESPIANLVTGTVPTTTPTNGLPTIIDMTESPDSTDGEDHEDLFLHLSHEEALFVAGYDDNGSDASEGFLDRRRGAYARRARMIHQ